MSAATDAGYLALQSGDVSGAIAQLEQAIAADPSDFQACLYLGAAYGQAERTMDAVTILTKAVQLQPANAQARYNLAVAYESAGYKEQATTAAQQAVQFAAGLYRKRRRWSHAFPAPLRRRPPTLRPPHRRHTVNPSRRSSLMASRMRRPRTANRPSHINLNGQPAAPQYGQPQQPQPPYGQQPQAPYGQPHSRRMVSPPLLLTARPSNPSSPSLLMGNSRKRPMVSLSSPTASRRSNSPMARLPRLISPGSRFLWRPAHRHPTPTLWRRADVSTEASDANTALILSIIGLLCCGLLAPVSIFFAMKAKKQIAENPNLTGGGKASRGYGHRNHRNGVDGIGNLLLDFHVSVRRQPLSIGKRAARTSLVGDPNRIL